ncbi:uncharacterized protein BKCO1_1000467 [Diplodia corticola]|uniref:Uncharacterized protein n=1 Tax=Diplodia corticola TaxID=236234 RepID=A0A1J9RIN9_9PEZI|nr:uncharacterized protein BKCO1_1000467 [Diplodia corticola]OJD40512.1 hypothetical protein BKCO1_1000467 [Diplodia corticola]
MSYVGFTRFTGNPDRCEPVEKVMAAEIADFNSFKRLLHEYYEAAEVEYDLHVHYGNKLPCSGASEMSPRLWNALASTRSASPSKSDFPVYFICFAKKGQSQSNSKAISSNSDKSTIQEARSNGLPNRQCDTPTPSPPVHDHIFVHPSPSVTYTTPVRSQTMTVSPSKETPSRKRQRQDQEAQERPAKSSRPAPGLLPQALENKLTGLTDTSEKCGRVVVGVDNDSTCAVWAARNSLGRIYLRKSAFDIEGEPLSDHEGGKRQKIEDTDFLPVSGNSTDSSWDAIKTWIDGRLDALEIASPRVQSARAQSTGPSVGAPSASERARVLKRGSTASPSVNRRSLQVHPGRSSPLQRMCSGPTRASSCSEQCSDPGESDAESTGQIPPDVNIRFTFKSGSSVLLAPASTVLPRTVTVQKMLKKAREFVREGTSLQFPDLEHAIVGGISVYEADKRQPLENYIPHGIEAVLHVETGWKNMQSS